ncbi:FHA domain-containing protein [Nocardia sp. NPDC059180]|uniref:FHA domain-containing protein n=1 Tax=Nocardia sp. NPDC059180 TaxID=3346761 RepID=UPI00369D6ECA
MSRSNGSERHDQSLIPSAGEVAWPLRVIRPTLCHQIAPGMWRGFPLKRHASSVTVGRSETADISVSADSTVSRLHAIIEWVCDCWVVVDNGLSKNGTFVNGERVCGCRRLNTGDVIRMGQSIFVLRDEESGYEPTGGLVGAPTTNSLTGAQYLVLEALCRPRDAQHPYAFPASNCQIAEELSLSIATVKTHMRALFRIFGIEELPPNQKRLCLVERAFASGVIVDSKLQGSGSRPTGAGPWGPATN